MNFCQEEERADCFTTPRTRLCAIYRTPLGCYENLFRSDLFTLVVGVLPHCVIAIVWHVTILCLLLTVSWVCLWYVIAAFAGQTNVLFANSADHEKSLSIWHLIWVMHGSKKLCQRGSNSDNVFFF